MPKSRIILATGFFIALLPILGFPYAWETFFQVVGGLGIVALSVLISIDKRILHKLKAERRTMRMREKIEKDAELRNMNNAETESNSQ
jgi:hypothetical protein